MSFLNGISFHVPWQMREKDKVAPTITAQVIPIRRREHQKAGTQPTTVTQDVVQWQWTDPTPSMIDHDRERSGDRLTGI